MSSRLNEIRVALWTITEAMTTRIMGNRNEDCVILSDRLFPTEGESQKAHSAMPAAASSQKPGELVTILTGERILPARPIQQALDERSLCAGHAFLRVALDYDCARLPPKTLPQLRVRQRSADSVG